MKRNNNQINQPILRKIVAAGLFSGLMLSSSVAMFAQSAKETILTIGNHHFSKDEYQYFYTKNNSQLTDQAEVHTPSEYMDLFIHFKLKVLEGELMGLDTLSSFKTELQGYRDELAKPYLTNVQFNDEMVQTAYFRTKNERKASHILIQIPEGGDTIKALERIQEIRNKWTAGADFNDLAFHYSEDPSARMNRGELGYFSAFMMVYPFEDAAYKTEVGQVSQPVRTQFGYHLIQVEDQRESKGQITVAHIMKRIQQDGADDGHGHRTTPRSEENIKTELDSLYQLLLNGADFSDLAQRYSDDHYSARGGGQLQPFTENRMVPEFAQAAFALKNDGDISPVVKSPYGWHIIKRIKHTPVPDFDELKNQLRENIRKNPLISKHSRDLFIADLKKQYQFHVDEKSMALLLKKKPNELQSAAMQSDSLNFSQTLFSYDGHTASIGDFLLYAEKNRGTAKSTVSLVDEFAAFRLIEYENSRLEAKYPDFSMLMKEYHDGMLLFAVSEKMIWNKAAEDSIGLSEFYERNKTKYLGDEKFSGWILQCRDLETRSRVDEILTIDPVDKEELLTIINASMPGALSVTEGIFSKGDNPIVDYYVWNGVHPAGMDEKTTYVRGDKLQPQPKTLTDSRGLHVADYQTELEKVWLNQLKGKYKIRVNKKLVKQIPSLK